jgi:hypothetical protein
MSAGWLAACGDDADATGQAATSTASDAPEPDETMADPVGEMDTSPATDEETTDEPPETGPSSSPASAAEPEVVEPEPTDPEPEASEPEPTDPEVVEPEPTDPQPEASEPEPATTGPIVEPVTEEDYYVRNDTTHELTVLATTVFGNEPVQLLEDTVPAEQEVHIYHAIEGSGGHAMPSNFFGDFQVLSGNVIVYQGVVNADWQDEQLGLVLVIEAEPEPSDAGVADAVDYSCAEASDCEVKNIGNCCGYYPRCVNVDSPTPEPECSDGAGGVCGWPDITHCECVENSCRSMQGDTEV